MLLYMSSQKFGSDTAILKSWIRQRGNKIVIILNALDAKEKEKAQKNIEEDIKSNYHKADLIDNLVNKCKNENIKYKAIKDGEVVILGTGTYNRS